MAAVRAEAELSFNPDGSLVDLPERNWLVCFVPPLDRRLWHVLVQSRFTHVFAIRKHKGRWTLFEPWWTRLLVANLSEKQALKYLCWADKGEVFLVPEVVPGHGSQMRGWMNCAGLVSYMLGRPYWVWTPRALYTRLRAERTTKAVSIPEVIRSQAPTGTARDPRQDPEMLLA